MDNWLGIIGVVTGPLSLIVSIAAYRRAGALKAADLMVEILKRHNHLTIEAPGLLPHLDLADRSRKAVSSAKGLGGSGAMVRWNQSFQADRTTAERLTEQASKIAAPTTKDSVTALTQSLASIDLLLEQVRALHAKYVATIAADDADRAGIAAFHHQVAAEAVARR